MTVEDEWLYRHDITTRKITRGAGQEKNFHVRVEEVNDRVESGAGHIIDSL